MIELEKTYLAKYIPEEVKTARKIEIVDVYIPKSEKHPILRLRKRGDKYEMTKKSPVSEGDSSKHNEHTIALSEEEFEALNEVSGKRVEKTRYEYKKNGQKFEVDVFSGSLTGLVLVDVEFDSEEVKNAFVAPEFCLAEVTEEEFTVGGMLCGKAYEDIEEKLKSFGYKKI